MEVSPIDIHIIPKRKPYILIGMILIVIAPVIYISVITFGTSAVDVTYTADGSSTTVRSVNPNVPAFDDFLVYTGFEQSSPDAKPTLAYIRFETALGQYAPEEVDQINCTFSVDPSNIAVHPSLEDETYIIDAWLVSSDWDAGLLWSTQNQVYPMSVPLANASFVPSSLSEIELSFTPTSFASLMADDVCIVLKLRNFEVPVGVPRTDAYLLLGVYKADIQLHVRLSVISPSVEIGMAIGMVVLTLFGAMFVFFGRNQ